MENNDHTLSKLFRQLGLPDGEKDIESFIAAHSPLAEGVHIENAPFWTGAQKQFIAEKFAEDAAWVDIIDHLSVRLRA